MYNVDLELLEGQSKNKQGNKNGNFVAKYLYILEKSECLFCHFNITTRYQKRQELLSRGPGDEKRNEIVSVVKYYTINLQRR